MSHSRSSVSPRTLLDVVLNTLVTVVVSDEIPSPKFHTRGSTIGGWGLDDLVLCNPLTRLFNGSTKNVCNVKTLRTESLSSTSGFWYVLLDVSRLCGNGLRSCCIGGNLESLVWATMCVWNVTDRSSRTEILSVLVET